MIELVCQDVGEGVVGRAGHTITARVLRQREHESSIGADAFDLPAGLVIAVTDQGAFGCDVDAVGCLHMQRGADGAVEREDCVFVSSCRYQAQQIRVGYRRRRRL